MTVTGSEWRPSTSTTSARNRSPRAVCASATSAVKSSPSTTQPADIVATLLLNVPACGIASGRGGSNWSISSARPPKAPKEKPPPKYLPKVRMSGVGPEQRGEAGAAVPRGHHLVGDADRAGAARRVEQPRRNSGSAGMQPPEPSIGSTSTAASSSRAPRSALACLEIVVRRDDEGVRRVPGRVAVREEEDAAVVAAVEDQDLRAAGDDPRGVIANRFASVPEFVNRTRSMPEALAHQLARARARTGWTPPTPRLRQRLVRRRRARAARRGRRARPCSRRGGRRTRARRRRSGRALASDERQRERRVVEDRPRVPTGQDAACLLVQPRALGISGGELAPRLGDERFQVRREPCSPPDCPTGLLRRAASPACSS